MENLKLAGTCLLICIIRESSTQSLPCRTASGDNCTSSICPNTGVTYTCTISGTAAGLTDWILPTGTCSTNNYPDKISLLQYTAQQCGAVSSSMCGPYRASSIQPSSGTYCLSSILTVNIVAAMNGSTVTCSNTTIGTNASTAVAMATINVVGPPGRPSAMANTTVPGMVLVVLNPSSSGGLPTSYSVTISNSSYMLVYSNSTPAFLNGSAMVTFTGLTNSTNYTISAVAINCAGSSSSSNTTTIYVSWAAPPPSPPTSSASITSPTSPATPPTSTQNTIIGTVVGGVVGGVAVVIVVIIIIAVLLIHLCSSSKTSTKYKIKGKREVSYHNPIAIQLEPEQPVRPPRDPPQVPSVPAEESLYNASTQNQRVPEESLYDGNVPNGRGGNVQEALYSQPDTSKKNADKMTYATVQVTPAARNPASGRAGRGVPPPNAS